MQPTIFISKFRVLRAVTNLPAYYVIWKFFIVLKSAFILSFQNQINLVYSLQSCSCKTYINITLPLSLEIRKRLSFRFWRWILYKFILLSHACHYHYPSYWPWRDNPSSMWRGVIIAKLLIYWFFIFTSYYLTVCQNKENVCTPVCYYEQTILEPSKPLLFLWVLSAYEILA